MALTKTSYSMVQGAPINVLDYMTPNEIADVVGNVGNIDVSAKIRLALDYAATLPAGAQVIFPAGTYYVPTTIFIPTQVGLSMVGFGATLKGAGEAVGTIFETGAQDFSTGGTTNWGFDETYLHRKQIIDGFTFIDCEYGIRAFNMLEGCVIQHNRANATVRTLLWAKRCFYLAILQNMHRGGRTTGNNDEDACFYIESFNNVMNIQGNSAYRGNNGALARGTGFRLSGGSSGMQLLNNVAEGCNKGILLTGSVYGLLISGWYLEGNVRDISIEDANPKAALSIDGCWFESDQTLSATGWLSGELGKNNYYYTNNSTVNLSDSTNACEVWLPRQLLDNAGSTEYDANIVPSGWTLSTEVLIRTQTSSYIAASGLGSQTSALATDFFSDDFIVPRHYIGRGENAKLPYCDVDTATLGQITVDTKIGYSDDPVGLRFDFKVTDNVGTYYLSGWVSETNVFRNDAVSGKTITASNNSGNYRLVIAGLDTNAAATISGQVRIV